MNSPTSSGWHRLATLVKDRRRALSLTQDEIKPAGGPSAATVRNIENATQDSYKPWVLSSLERALGWEAGSIASILTGGEPTPYEDAADRQLAENAYQDPLVAEIAARLERLEEADRRHRRENAELRRMLAEITGETPPTPAESTAIDVGDEEDRSAS